MRLWAALVVALGLLACAMVDNAVDRTQMEVAGARLYISGEITSRTPANFERLLAENPQLRIVLPRVMQGSLDDQAVNRMGYAIRERGLETHLGPDSEIYSGAVDLFLAGQKRSMAEGAVIGVHSWADGFGEGRNYPADAIEHRANAVYVRDMLGTDDFYWFTLRAAPADGIHLLTRDEIARFGLLTAPIRN